MKCQSSHFIPTHTCGSLQSTTPSWADYQSKESKGVPTEKDSGGKRRKSQDRWRRPAASSEEAKEADPSPVQPEPAFNRLAINSKTKEKQPNWSDADGMCLIQHQKKSSKLPQTHKLWGRFGSTLTRESKDVPSLGGAQQLVMESHFLRRRGSHVLQQSEAMMRLNERNNLGWILCRVWANLITVTSAEVAFSCQPKISVHVTLTHPTPAKCL